MIAPPPVDTGDLPNDVRLDLDSMSELERLSSPEVVTAIAGAALPVAAETGNPRRLEECEEATEAGRPRDDGAKIGVSRAPGETELRDGIRWCDVGDVGGAAAALVVEPLSASGDNRGGSAGATMGGVGVTSTGGTREEDEGGGSGAPTDGSSFETAASAGGTGGLTTLAMVGKYPLSSRLVFLGLPGVKGVVAGRFGDVPSGSSFSVTGGAAETGRCVEVSI